VIIAGLSLFCLKSLGVKCLRACTGLCVFLTLSLVSNLCGTPKKINGVACTDVVCTPIEL